MTKTAKEIREELDAKREKQKGGKYDWFSPKPGIHYIRIAPPWKKDGDFWKDVLIHGFFKDKVYCRHNEKDVETGKVKKCAIERRLRKLKNDRSPFGKKLWSLIRQRSESLWNVFVGKVDRDGSKLTFNGYVDKKAKVWRLSSQWHDAMVEFFADDDYREKSVLGITHSRHGRWVKINRVGEGRDDTKYTFTIVDVGKLPSALAPTKMKRKKLLATVTDLDKMVHGSSQEELEAFLEKMSKRAREAVRKEKEEKENFEEDEEEDLSEDEEEDEDEGDEEEDGGSKHRGSRRSSDSRSAQKTKHSRSDDADDDRVDEGDGKSGDRDNGRGDEDDEDEDEKMERKYAKLKKEMKEAKKHKHDEEDEEEDE